MTPYLYLSILLAASVSATTFRRKNYKSNFDDSSENFSSGYNAYSSYGSSEGRNSQNKRDFSGYDGDDYIPPVGIQHNNDYSGLGDGDGRYHDYSGGSGTNGGAVSYSQVISEHRPAHRTVSSPRLKAEGSNVIEKPVAVPFKVPFPIVPAFDRSILPFVPVAPITPVITPVKYPIQFFKPISYLAPEKNPVIPAKNEQPEYVLTKVPLVYHATYSETPQGQSGLTNSGHSNHPSTNVHPVPNQFNQGVPHFNQGASNFNNGGNNFNHGANHFNHAATNIRSGATNFNQGTSSLNHGSPNLYTVPSNFNNGAANFNSGSSNFNNIAPNFNSGSSLYNHGANNFNNNFNHGNQHGANQINPTITTPGTPGFNSIHHPIPLLPTPTPYHHHHSRH